MHELHPGMFNTDKLKLIRNGSRFDLSNARLERIEATEMQKVNVMQVNHCEHGYTLTDGKTAGNCPTCRGKLG
jgi:hypothetical protein